MKKTAKKKAAPAEREVVVEQQLPDTVKTVKARVKQCAFCKHYYIKPCDDKSKDRCPNYLHVQTKVKKGKTK